MDAAGSRIESWGRHLAGVLSGGGRLLACGNGGSAAEAQHLTGELVGRFLHDRRPLSAIALHADTSALTAIGNDYGETELFARQVVAHGRPGDVLVALSTISNDAVAVPAPGIATVQEIHLVVVHVLCAALDEALGVTPGVRR
jgi:D-sedoheptulose 7-phosphate isomerase